MRFPSRHWARFARVAGLIECCLRVRVRGTALIVWGKSSGSACNAVSCHAALGGRLSRWLRLACRLDRRGTALSRPIRTWQSATTSARASSLSPKITPARAPLISWCVAGVPARPVSPCAFACDLVSAVSGSVPAPHRGIVPSAAAHAQPREGRCWYVFVALACLPRFS